MEIILKQVQVTRLSTLSNLLYAFYITKLKSINLIIIALVYITALTQ